MMQKTSGRHAHGPGRPDDEPSGSTSQRPGQKRRREATLYDAVAGRVGYEGFLPGIVSQETGERTSAPKRNPYTSRTRDRPNDSVPPVYPEEVLFRRAAAPERYEENDLYFAHETECGPGAVSGPAQVTDVATTTNTGADAIESSPAQKVEAPLLLPELPGSDLLKALHAYTANYFSRAFTDGTAADFESMDETALIAMGVLLEESTGSALGRDGDMAFVDDGVYAPQDIDRADSEDGTWDRQGWYWDGKQLRRSVLKRGVKRRRGRSADGDGDAKMAGVDGRGGSGLDEDGDDVDDA